MLRPSDNVDPMRVRGTEPEAPSPKQGRPYLVTVTVTSRVVLRALSRTSARRT